jgi:lipoprotein-anchoring transpeptidase ErfK/SrfK
MPDESMTHPHTAPDPRRRVGPLLLLAAWLLTAAGCAQMSFPDLPPTMQTSQEETSEPPEAETPESGEGSVAETSEPPPESEPTPEAAPGQLFEWSGDGRDITRIVIDTNAQTATFFAGAERVGWTTIASGVSSHPTPRGQFSILEKVRDKRSNMYGKIVGSNGRVIRASAHGRDPVPRGARFVGASMPHFMRLTYDGIGMHAGPIPNPGQPASHGCIRMPPDMAAAVFAHVGPDTAVTVVGDGPDYGNYAARIERQRAEERARRAAAAAAAEGTALDALDAEIEALEEAGVEVPRSAPDAVAPAQGAGGGQAAGTADRPAGGAGEPRSGTQTPASAPDPEPAAANSGADTADAGTSEEADTSEEPSARAPQAGAARGSDTNAGSGTRPTRQPGPDQPEQRARPDAEAMPTPDAPSAAPDESLPDYYGPPAPAPTIRSAGTAVAAARA